MKVSNVASRLLSCKPAQIEGTMPVADGYYKYPDFDVCKCNIKIAVFEIVAGRVE